ncbi:MAG: polyprenyl synthetase family protein, partial [Pirellulales bacterium]|nr:polyprenyl synthetase family protein [Pirellulales bacterium]
CGTVGAILAGADDGLKRSVGEYGLNIGIAFQLIDDALDYSSSEEEFGKGVGQDLVEGKMTLPLYYSIRDATDTEKSRAHDILASENGFDDGELDFIRDIVDRYNGVEKTKDVARDYIHKARESLNPVPENVYKNSLGQLADFVAERKN